MPMKWVWTTIIAIAFAGMAEAASNPFGLLGGFSPTSTIPVDVSAPTVDVEQGGKKMIASGGVTVIRGDEKLTANTIIFDKITETAMATGNVVFVKSNMVWRGETFTYNLADGTWSTGGFDANYDPFHMTAASATKTNDYFLLNRAVVTTCTNEPGHYHYTMNCRRVRVYPNDHFVARHMVLRFGGIPMFYLPYWYSSLSDRSVGMSVQAGYRSRMGAYLLTSTKYWMTSNLRGITHLDYRTERGPAVGQEIGWVNDADTGKGRIYGYYTDDQGVQKDFDKGKRSEVIDSQRYRLTLDHMQTFGAKDYFLSDFTYLSDQYVLEDFFEREYRNSFQPENYATFVHREENTTYSLSTYKRLNDFYEAVDRLPEFKADVQRSQIADSPFYYEGRNSVAYLQKLYPDGSGSEEYSAGRADTSHELYYPTRHFGFLNVTPRTGYRATYYSETVNWRSVTQLVATVTSNSSGGVTSGTSTNISQVPDSMGSDLRSLFNIGLETSFRAFKVVNNDENMFGTGLRHVVEPYTDYTFVPEPNIRPAQLYQFDEIDALDRRNDLRFGLRNRLQTKRQKAVSDIADLDVFTTYSFEEADQDEPFSNVGMKAEFNLAKWCQIYMDGTYDLYASQINTYNTQARFKVDEWRANIEQRYLVESSSLLITDLAWLPNKRWEFGVYDRFEFETSTLEEQGLSVTRKYDCMSVALGGSYLPAYTRDDGSEREADYRVMFELSFLAFPNLKLGSMRRD
jgi:lipopolysaccharide assembly outer membrane protein LptD (OstA)